MQTIFTIIGNLSFGLMALSFLMREIVWLRSFALASGVMGISYNSAIALGVFGVPTPELWQVVGWLVLFLAINVGQTVMLIIENNEIKLEEDDKAMLSMAFPSMRTRDFKLLMSHAVAVSHEHGDKLIEINGRFDSVLLVKEGVLTEVDVGGAIRKIKRGSFIGEASYILGNDYGGAPAVITADGKCQLLAWKYDDLRKLATRPEIARALVDSFFRGIVKRRELLLRPNVVPEALREVLIPVEDKLVHAATFPDMTTLQFSRLLELSTREQYEEGAQIESSNRFGVINRGAMMVMREDNQTILLGSGQFVGEVGLMAQRKYAVRATLRATRPCEIIWWSRECVNEMVYMDPPLYGRLMGQIAKDMAIKLTQPLSSVEDAGAPMSYYMSCKYPGCADGERCLRGAKGKCVVYPGKTG